ncbi:MAG: hypothetical protein AB1521_10815 [Bacteroidota bacterium]
MHKKIFIGLFYFLFFLSVSYPQYNIEFNETKGSLDLTDKYKLDFGRYDGYEISFYQGEAVNLIVQSDSFLPKLFFVSPKGEIFKQSADSRSNIASIISKIPESGNWLLYIVGDSSSIGGYTFQYAFASANSLRYQGDSTFCSILHYLTAHSKAYFLLLENSYDPDYQLIKFPKSIDSFLDEETGNYISQVYGGNDFAEAKNKFDYQCDEIKRCLDGNWKQNNIDWYMEKDYKISETLFVETSNEIGRVVLVRFFDFRNSREKFLDDFVINVELARTK